MELRRGSTADRVQGPMGRTAGYPFVRRETRGSSMSCPRCGERLQSDKRLTRKLWCGKCRIVMDRDMVAAINLARRGPGRVARSPPPTTLKGQGRGRGTKKREPAPTGNPRVEGPK